MRTNFFSSRDSSSIHSESTTTSSSSSSSNRSRYTFSDQMMEENIDNAEAIITQWEVQGGSTYSNFSSLFRNCPKQAKQLLGAIHELKETMQYLIKNDSSSESLIRAQNLMDLAMRRLEKEFHYILSRNREILDPESISNASSTSTSCSDDEESTHNNNDEVEEEPKNHNNSIMEDLKIIAECMISSGYSKECVTIYKLARKSIVDESLYNLGVLEKILTPSQIQKHDWDYIELKIKNWLKGIKIAIKNIFLGERILCDYVFSSSEKMIESIFVEVARDRALALFTFPEIVAKYKKLSPEKMFRILDLYEAISTLWPEIEVIFSFDSFSAVRSQAVTSMVKLGEGVRFMLSEFESAVQKDTSKAVPGGGIHPLTRYVMNYLVFLADYRDSLEDIVTDWPLVVKSPLPDAYFWSRASDDSSDDCGESPLAQRVAWLILVLLCKLDAKAELYKNVALAYLFLANNLNYVVTKIRNSNLITILGSEWLSKNGAKVRQYVSNYGRMGWSKVFSAFPDDPMEDMSQEYVRDCFKKFNSGFEEAYRIQSTWVIPDPKLREQVKVSLAKKIVPTYKEFYEHYRGTFRREIGQESIVRYAPEDLDNYLSDLFLENGGISGSTTTSF
ncbi:membrane traffic protein [Lithospermum erythrorhizon]|uniref:Exocyst subunit Exo70 family protein n=1 Tax=Lithospermum erythrorhizon TaxID=34254 RepID=A0AAV3PU83_LITER